MIYKITITGTESTGKSTLAEKLSAHYNTVCVPDYSRYYIQQLNNKYSNTDVLEIARGIIEQEDRMIQDANKILFSDNDLLNVKIWLQYYKWEIPIWLNDEIEKRKSHLFLLCDIDLPWIPDGQRSNPNDRKELFDRFQYELKKMNANFHIIKGTTLQERLRMATQYIGSQL